ncbi:MAG: LuxR family transcriptional regulator [Gammaproteobacteria bacterium]|nr:LuxR family transcriptional regulator [Gammaproteobacteria bacterium]|tara:strand:+ start:1833 stop:2210 length:378 start_codon:yes stop_codon:yes gene_type:complete
MGFLKNYEPQTYASLRIVSGFLFIFHGVPKIQAIIEGDAGWMYYLAGPIELIGGAMIMIGLYTSVAAFLSSGLMAGAYWLIHFSKMGGGWPINNKGDAAVLFCFVFLYIAAKGGGKWSLDERCKS